MPYYEVDIPQQEGKFFGVMAATRYETITVRETVRPVCLYVDGNVPSCDHVIHSNHKNRPQKVPGPANSRRPPVVDYETYFIEPSKPNAKIEITEIPYRGAFLLTDATVEADGQLQAAEEDASEAVGHETPALQQAVRPVAEDVQERRTAAAAHADRRQLLQNAFGAASAAVAAGVANVGGVVGMAGAVANAAVGRQQVTVYVTRVDRVVDDRITATLVPKNCMPARVDALRRCNGAVDPYSAALPEPAYMLPQQPAYMQDEPAVAVDIVSKVGGLVRDFVHAQSVATGGGGGLRRYRRAPETDVIARQPQ
ncbi:uncharacterized protein LOC112591898 [Melanaphis sacchari]|uniref:uncharacterized protein LOC112591898 n=1 Tax=Melanaphis sacchari TaxID=742174 RepID=UPI000DC13CB6|nr:uncharacterized protein LOC112591898 [Melanaphis sacchari]